MESITTVINDEYIEAGLVLLSSLLTHSMLDNRELVIIAADGDGRGRLSRQNRARIDQLQPARYVKVENLRLYEQFLLGSPWSEPQFLPAYFSLEVFLNPRFEEYETICYIDADTLCLRDFEYVFSEYDRERVNGSRTCQAYFGYPNVMDTFYLNSGFFVVHGGKLPDFRRCVREIEPDIPHEFFFGYWDQLVINKALRSFIHLPFEDCNFKPMRENVGHHRLVHFSGPEWKPWKNRLPPDEFRYLFELWWTEEAALNRRLESSALPVSDGCDVISRSLICNR